MHNCCLESINLLSSLHLICFAVVYRFQTSLIADDWQRRTFATTDRIYYSTSILQRQTEYIILRRLWKGRLFLIKKNIALSSEHPGIFATRWITITLCCFTGNRYYKFLSKFHRVGNFQPRKIFVSMHAFRWVSIWTEQKYVALRSLEKRREFRHFRRLR